MDLARSWEGVSWISKGFWIRKGFGKEFQSFGKDAGFGKDLTRNLKDLERFFKDLENCVLAWCISMVY